MSATVLDCQASEGTIPIRIPLSRSLLETEPGA